MSSTSTSASRTTTASSLSGSPQRTIASGSKRCCRLCNGCIPHAGGGTRRQCASAGAPQLLVSGAQPATEPCEGYTLVLFGKVRGDGPGGCTGTTCKEAAALARKQQLIDRAGEGAA